MRVSRIDLENLVIRLHAMTANRYQISGAYGGVQLRRFVGNSASEDVFNTGHTTKSNLSDLINAYIIGIKAGASHA
jgi:hypothetical protein